LPIVVYTRSWRNNIRVEGSDFHKKEKEAKRKNPRKGRPVETAAVCGKSIKVAFGNILLMISHNCLKKACAKNAPAFFTVPHRPDGD
jgi:hypothetical protein